MRERDRDRDRDRDRQRERQAGRQAGRQTDRYRGAQTHTDWQRKKQIYRTMQRERGVSERERE